MIPYGKCIEVISRRSEMTCSGELCRLTLALSSSDHAQAFCERHSVVCIVELS